MICEFAKVNNKQKPPITNLILGQIWETTSVSESTGSKEPVDVSCMYTCMFKTGGIGLHSYNTSKFYAGEKVEHIVVTSYHMSVSQSEASMLPEW